MTGVKAFWTWWARLRTKVQPIDLNEARFLALEARVEALESRLDAAGLQGRF